MRYQTPGTPRCGPAALGNALRALGRSAPREGTLARLCGTTSEGTGEEGIRDAARALGLAVRVLAPTSRMHAWAALCYALSEGAPVIVHLPGPDHWVVVCGRLGSRVVVIDSSNSVDNTRENGVRVHGRRAWIDAWGARGEYFGLVLS